MIPEYVNKNTAFYFEKAVFTISVSIEVVQKYSYKKVNDIHSYGFSVLISKLGL
jgi:hypothetical protein